MLLALQRLHPALSPEHLSYPIAHLSVHPFTRVATGVDQLTFSALHLLHAIWTNVMGPSLAVDEAKS